MFKTLKKLYFIFDKRTGIQFVLLFGLLLVSAIFETGGIGLIVPFVAIIADPGLIESNRWLQLIYTATGAQSVTAFLIYVSIGLLLFYIVKNLFLGLVTYSTERFVFSKRSALGARVFRLYLNCPYSFHLEHNTAELDRNMRFEVPYIFGFIQSLLVICAELSVLIMVVIMMILINPIVVICSTSVLGVVSVFFYKLFGKRAKMYGKKVQSSQMHVGQSVIEGFGAIKEIKISGKENYFPKKYYTNMMDNARANWRNRTLSKIPRLLMEVLAVGSVILTIIVLLVYQNQDFKSLLPTLSLLALATIRLVPSLSKIVSSLQQLRFSTPAVDVIYNEIMQYEKTAIIENRNNHPLVFKKIKIRNLSYTYQGASEKALQKISLNINKGQSIAFIGSSGAGKTTLANIILGIIEPHEGAIYGDNQNIWDNLTQWQNSIGYVPQSIYLLDASIRSNIAFGLEGSEIDNAKVWEALKVAQLDEFVEHLPDGINNFIGENGVRLSGGQRQRLGIARAIYHQPEVLILDEATSALDSKTEKEVSTAIEAMSGKKTLIIIAHRLSTIKKCDCIYFMQEGSIVDSGSFDELALKNFDFKRMVDIDSTT